MRFARRLALAVTLFAALAAPPSAQAPSAQPPAAQPSAAAPTAQDPAGARPQQTDIEMSLVTTASLLKTIAQKEVELRAKQTEAAAEMVEGARLNLLGDVGKLREELARKKQELEFVASGIDRQAPSGKLDLVGEIEELVRPVIEGLKELTAEPRKLDQIQAEIAAETERIATIDRGIKRVRELREQAQTQLTKAPTDALLPAATLTDLVRALEEVEAHWRQNRDGVEGNLQVLGLRKHQLEHNRRPFLETAQALIGGFFKERGLNVLLALLAFCLVLFALRWLYRPVAARLQRERRRSFSVRLLAVGYHVMVGVLAVAAALVVLYIADDWVLLGLAALFLVGLAWAGKQTLPRFYREARLLLNVGEVREQERVVLDGLSWRVDRLHLQAILVNPALTGGMLRLPLRDLIGMRSRPSTAREPWFPCVEGDWVVVGDLFGRVHVQTPQTVELMVQGARRSMTTASFLAANPTNLSGGFGFRATFGIDYRHQAIATTDVPRVMREALGTRLRQLPGGEGLVALRVEFAAAGNSSLDYRVIGEFEGTVAQHYLSLQRSVQRILVDLCNEQGWVIPFPQLTVHRA